MYGEMRANFPETFRAPHDMADAALAQVHGSWMAGREMKVEKTRET